MKMGKEVDLLPNMTPEKALLAQNEKEINIPEKRALDAAAEIPLVKKARNGVTA
jgi:homocitrate synthase